MIQDYIKNHAFFHNWNDEYREKIIQISSLETFPKNHRIINKGFLVDKFYIIVSRLVEVKLMDIVLQILGSGEVVSWSWLIPPYTWNFSVDTTKETILIQINCEKLKKNFESNEEIECLIYKSYVFCGI